MNIIHELIEQNEKENPIWDQDRLIDCVWSSPFKTSPKRATDAGDAIDLTFAQKNVEPILSICFNFIFSFAMVAIVRSANKQRNGFVTV